MVGLLKKKGYVYTVDLVFLGKCMGENIPRCYKAATLCHNNDILFVCDLAPFRPFAFKLQVEIQQQGSGH